MSQTLIPILIFLSVVLLGGAVLLVRAARRRTLEARLHGADPTTDATARSGRGAGFVEAVDQIGRAVAPERSDAGLRQKLIQAGYYDDAAATVYVGAQLLLALLGLAFGGLLAFSINMDNVYRVCLVLIVLIVLALAPNLYLSIRRRQRTDQVRRALPDAIDLLEICVTAGMGLDIAWNSVTDEVRDVSPVLSDEMALANLEIHLGAQRADALRHMAERTGADEIASLVSALVQSERFGTSIRQALRTYAEAMRTERSQRAEEAAQKLAVKLLFPMVLFIFPCMFVVILAPAAIRIAEMFQKG